MLMRDGSGSCANVSHAVKYMAQDRQIASPHIAMLIECILGSVRKVWTVVRGVSDTLKGAQNGGSENFKAAPQRKVLTHAVRTARK